jgi:aspartyl-tRNA(Asn)/glutamyl-tRNA(Gln) amidotransferase subunit C
VQIGQDDVMRIAKLARLELSEAETEAFSAQLSRILTYVDQLKKLNTSGVNEAVAAPGAANVFRPDKARGGLTQEAALANAPDTDNGYFRVPRIIQDVNREP